MPSSTPAPLRVLIVEDDTLVGMGLKAHLEKLGHRVVGQASSTAAAADLFNREKPDLVLLDIRLDQGDGLELAASLRATRRVPMVVVTAYSDADLIRRAGEAGVFGYLIKPVTAESLAAQIEVALHRSRDAETLIERTESLSKQLETRKLVEKAKGILMKRLALSEPEAHKRLQLESQKRRLAIGDMAQKII
jgi:response regulator NasT